MPIKRLITIFSKTIDPYRILWLGIAFGLTLTAFLWWGNSSQIDLALHWISYAGISTVGLFLLVRTRRRGFTLLALFASVSLVYLFPALLGPACDGMPRAFARDTKCTHRWDCADNECCHAGECLPNSDPKCGGEEPPVELPPVISGVLSCSSPGNGGWCLGGLVMQLSASDPQARQIIISGDVNGNTFACPSGDTACSVPITIDGSGTVNYIVNSATGLSASGSASYALDATTPQIDGSLSGASGTPDWFTSDVTFTASASDALSGMSAFQTSTDGGAWTDHDYTAPLTLILSDGVHALDVRAYDNAGNLATTTQTISVDKFTPQLDIFVSGTLGSNTEWYVSKNVQVSAIASDSGSEIFTLEVSIDSGAWENYRSPITLTDGIHNIQFRATDNAGLVTKATQTVKVDTVTPSLTLSVSGTQGLNEWFTSNMQVAANYSDAGSGVASVEAAVDGVWAPVSAPLSLSDGIHTWQFRVKDQAGHLTQTPVQTVKVDTLAPFIGMTETLSLGETLEYELQDDGSGLAIYRAVIEDDAEKYKKIVWVGELSGSNKEGEILWDAKFADGIKAGVGEYFITLKISDAAGNESMKTAVVDVSLLSLFQDLPVFTAPESTAVVETAVKAPSSAFSTDFGGSASEAVAEKTSSHFSAGGIPAEGKAVSVHTFTKPSETAAAPISTSNILWGAAAAALVGSTLAEWKRKREEPPVRIREKGEMSLKAKREAEKKHDAAVRARWAAAEVVNSRGMDSKTNRMDDAEGIAIAQEKKEAREEQSKAAKEKQQATAAAQQQALKGFRAGEVASYAVTPKVEEKKSWWGSLVDAGKGLLNAGTSALAGLVTPAKVTGGGSKPLYAPALDGGQGWWDTVKGTIFNGVEHIKNEIKSTVNKIGEAANEAFSNMGNSIKEAWKGNITFSQAWDNSTVAIGGAYNNSVNAIEQGYVQSQEIYYETVDTVIRKSAVWLDEKKNPIYDLGVFGLEKLSGEKLIEARDDVFSDINPLGSVFNLGKPDFFETGLNLSAGGDIGITKSISFVGIPETYRDPVKPDNNQIGLFYAPGVEVTFPGIAIVNFYGTGYMLPGADKLHPIAPSIDRYRDSVIAVGLGGYGPIEVPVGGGMECYDSMTNLQKIPENVDDTLGWLTTPGLMPIEGIWQKYISGEDVQSFPKVIGRPQTVSEVATMGCRVYVGAGTPGPEVHVGISDAQYVNILGGSEGDNDHRWRWVNVPTPIMNAIIDLRASPSQWGW